MNTEQERQWLSTNLKIKGLGSNQNNYSSVITGLGLNFDVYRTINEQHYGAYSPDMIHPVGSAFSAMTYSDKSCAAVAYKGTDNRTFTMAIPFECIKDKALQKKIMRGIVSFLLK